MIHPAIFENADALRRLAALNLEYDLSPAGFVRAIVCESGLVTPADVPSFLR